MTRKARLERVHGEVAIQALTQAKYVSEAWSRYIILHFRATGNLAPGCDMRDFSDWIKANVPDQWEAKLRPSQKR